MKIELTDKEYEYVWNKNTIDLEEFVNGGVAVWCEDKQKMDDFFNVLKEHEFLWETGRPLKDETYYSLYKNRTAYNFENIGILYSTVRYYKTLRYKVVKWEVI